MKVFRLRKRVPCPSLRDKEADELMKKTVAGRIALGGVLAALAVVIMSLGGLIPVNTYVCPLISTALLQIVLRLCGARVAWGWYGVVCILVLLLGPDKEAVAVFVFLGYYPIIKPLLDKLKLSILWKFLYFNCTIGLLYGLLIWALGITQIAAEFSELGMIGLVILLVLGNATFYLLDVLLNRVVRKI